MRTGSRYYSAIAGPGRASARPGRLHPCRSRGRSGPPARASNLGRPERRRRLRRHRPLRSRAWPTGGVRGRRRDCVPGQAGRNRRPAGGLRRSDACRGTRSARRAGALPACGLLPTEARPPSCAPKSPGAGETMSRLSQFGGRRQDLRVSRAVPAGRALPQLAREGVIPSAADRLADRLDTPECADVHDGRASALTTPSGRVVPPLQPVRRSTARRPLRPCRRREPLPIHDSKGSVQRCLARLKRVAPLTSRCAARRRRRRRHALAIAHRAGRLLCTGSWRSASSAPAAGEPPSARVSRGSRAG
jgi:hypothetical protein